MGFDLETFTTIRREQVEREVHSARGTQPARARPDARRTPGAGAWRNLPGFRRHVVDT